MINRTMDGKEKQIMISLNNATQDNGCNTMIESGHILRITVAIRNWLEGKPIPCFKMRVCNDAI